MAERVAVEHLLENARSLLPRRATPRDLDGVRERGGVVVDTRPVAQRQRDGALPGAVIIERNVLEWRLDPSSEQCIPQASTYDIEIVIVCNEGYASSLAAATLQLLGLHRATDLAGGYQAWAREGGAVASR